MVVTQNHDTVRVANRAEFGGKSVRSIRGISENRRGARGVCFLPALENPAAHTDERTAELSSFVQEALRPGSSAALHTLHTSGHRSYRGDCGSAFFLSSKGRDNSLKNVPLSDERHSARRGCVQLNNENPLLCTPLGFEPHYTKVRTRFASANNEHYSTENGSLGCFSGFFAGQRPLSKTKSPSQAATLQENTTSATE